MCPSIFDTVMQLTNSLILSQLKGAGGQKVRLQILQAACRDHEALKTAIDFLRITPEEACKVLLYNVPLAQMKWLAETYQISKKAAVQAFEQACVRGSIDTARWLADHFQLTREDLFPVDESPTALTKACCSGDIELVKWLIETYKFTLNDIKNCDILESARRNYQLVEYLIKTFDFDRGYAILVFHRACDRGNLDLAQTLAEFYEFTVIEVRRANRALLYCDNPWVREWLLKTYYNDIN